MTVATKIVDSKTTPHSVRAALVQVAQDYLWNLQADSELPPSSCSCAPGDECLPCLAVGTLIRAGRLPGAIRKEIGKQHGGRRFLRDLRAYR